MPLTRMSRSDQARGAGGNGGGASVTERPVVGLVMRQVRTSVALASILLIPGLATLWTAWEKFMAPLPPVPVALTLAGAGALAVNLLCAFMLVRFHAHSGSLTRAAFLSARNDAVANVAIIVAGFVTAYTLSGWPDLIVGLGIAGMNADATRQVWSAAHEEHRVANA
jgi:Co/Zn/Cd efflux system component